MKNIGFAAITAACLTWAGVGEDVSAKPKAIPPASFSVVVRDDGVMTIPGVREPEELLFVPISKHVKSPADDALAALVKADGGKSMPTVAEAQQVLQIYPDYPLAHLVLAADYCQSGQLVKIPGEVDAATKGAAQDSDMRASKLTGLKAFALYKTGDDAGALSAIAHALAEDPASYSDLMKGSGTTPPLTSQACEWSVPDIDELVRKHPSDSVALIMRGLFYASFNFLDPNTIPLAKRDLEAAIKADPQSGLRWYLLASTNRGAYFGKMDQDKPEGFNAAVEAAYSRAIALSPKLQPAYAERAALYFDQKRYADAIKDYDAAIDLSPSDSADLNDRAMAKAATGDNYSAIVDFTAAIRLKSHDDLFNLSYEYRGDAYSKLGQWQPAIDDYSTAIGQKIASVVILGSIGQFRQLYPEYARVPDEVLTHKLAATFDPDVDEAYVQTQFRHVNKPYALDVADLFVKRAGAQLRAGNWAEAAKDYQRAKIASPDYPTDRWSDMGRGSYFDLQTVSGLGSGTVRFWIKQYPAPDATSGPYSVSEMEVVCAGRQMRTVSQANYDANGQLLSSSGATGWTDPIPETRGEALVDGACHN